MFYRLTATYEFWLLHILTVVGGINHSIATVYNSDRYIVIFCYDFINISIWLIMVTILCACQMNIFSALL